MNYTLYVVPALAVALLGRLTSVGITCAAGLGLGAFQGLVTFTTAQPWWPSWASTGLGDAIPFLVIVAALFLFGPRLPSRGTTDSVSLPAVVPPRMRPGVICIATAAGIAALAFTSGSYRFGVVTSMIVAVLALSLVVLTGMVGQVSLAQAAFAGAAGFALSRLTTTWAVPFPLSMLLAALCAGLLGVMVGLPALRIRGVQLAVVTLAAAVAIERLVFRNRISVPVAATRSQARPSSGSISASGAGRISPHCHLGCSSSPCSF